MLDCHPDPELAEGEGPLHFVRSVQRLHVYFPDTILAHPCRDGRPRPSNRADKDPELIAGSIALSGCYDNNHAASC